MGQRAVAAACRTHRGRAQGRQARKQWGEPRCCCLTFKSDRLMPRRINPASVSINFNVIPFEKEAEGKAGCAFFFFFFRRLYILAMCEQLMLSAGSPHHQRFDLSKDKSTTTLFIIVVVVCVIIIAWPQHDASVLFKLFAQKIVFWAADWTSSHKMWIRLWQNVHSMFVFFLK